MEKMAVIPLLLLSSLYFSQATRDVVSFDFGWKHRTGLHAPADPDAPPPANPDPGANPAEAAVSYDDKDWEAVQLPHDGLIAMAPSQTACPDGCSGYSYIPRHVLWYRKAFNIPAEWKGSAIWLDFKGSFRETTVWVNGAVAARHICGYTPFRVRLDNITGVVIGGSNQLAVFVDPDNGDRGGQDHGSGWWYEGGGLYRHVNLVRATPVHVEQDGLFAYSNITFADNGPSAVVTVKAAVYNSGNSDANANVQFFLTQPNGALAPTPSGGWPVSTVEIHPGETVEAKATIDVAAPETVVARITKNCIRSRPKPLCLTVKALARTKLIKVNRTHGFRHLR